MTPKEQILALIAQKPQKIEFIEDSIKGYPKADIQRAIFELSRDAKVAIDINEETLELL